MALTNIRDQLWLNGTLHRSTNMFDHYSNHNINIYINIKKNSNSKTFFESNFGI